MLVRHFGIKVFGGNFFEKKQKFTDQIGAAFENIGFVALSGHFLSEELVENLYSEIKKFFNLPQETKDTYEK